ncbi:MAG: valine--tRNA ligase [Dehalococcoidia bacterium]|nr:valine--tRNA ligase [Dehalococcoidia bacterium]
MEPEGLAKTYEPGRIETKWYQFWLEQGYFKPTIDPKREPFVMTMPPPNVTGELHVGHALTMVLEDIMIRWHRMCGDPSLWVPGTDHAGIATQVLVEKDLAVEGLTKYDVGRDEFLRRAWERVERSRGTIRQQNQMLGSSCDWSREAFTLDEGPSRAVRTAFVRLYDKGLLYRGERMVNWCPRCQTALSDLEVEHQDTEGHLYYFKYPFADGSGYITIATTRPETCYGDMAVAVSPMDERYIDSVGKMVVLPVSGREIAIIADDAVDPAFGTGALKITPSHDPTDMDVADRHKLPGFNVFNSDGTMNENAGDSQGLDRMACRDKVVELFTDRGLLDHIEPHAHKVGHCSRCREAVEPRISLQWFVDTKPIAEPAIQAVRDGRIRIIPEHFTKVYYTWMESIRDWCVSRQLWWGHRIPVWYCDDCNALTVSVETPTSCAKCGSPHIEQDPDVLDTWFSSALWPHSTLGWPDDTEDLRYFYPTAVMETGYDILFFWVARMIMMGIEDTGEIPFHTIYLNGLIRDEHGQKMSKMRGNVIKPDEAIGAYGVDALRFALTTGNSPGNDLSFGAPKLEASRNFVNKLWNATRFVVQSSDGAASVSGKMPQPLQLEDRWIVSRLNRVSESVNALMKEYQLGEAERQIHDFIWSEFCDWYIEIAKMRLRTTQGAADTVSPLPYLIGVLEASLRLLHPFMPFVTEELWQTVQPSRMEDTKAAPSIMVSPYPVADERAYDVNAERAVGAAIDIVRALRNARAERKLEVARWMEARLYSGSILEELKMMVPMIEHLSRTHILEVDDTAARQSNVDTQGTIILTDAEIVLTGITSADIEKIREALVKESDSTRARLDSIEVRLADEVFVTRAPAEVVAKQRDLAASLTDKLARLDAELGELG